MIEPNIAKKLVDIDCTLTGINNTLKELVLEIKKIGR